MSDRTAEERAVEESITAAIQTANPGTIVTGWVVVVQTTVPCLLYTSDAADE